MWRFSWINYKLTWEFPMIYKCRCTYSKFFTEINFIIVDGSRKDTCIGTIRRKNVFSQNKESKLRDWLWVTSFKGNFVQKLVCHSLFTLSHKVFFPFFLYKNATVIIIDRSSFAISYKTAFDYGSQNYRGLDNYRRLIDFFDNR